MGSRGQALKIGGFTEYRYHTIARYNNVRFIVQNEGKRVKLPEMSNSRWAVYATLGNGGEIKSITFYNSSRRKYKEFDMDKPHKGLLPHVHTCNPKTSLRIDSKIPPRKPTSHEMNRIQKIIGFYNRHNLKDFVNN